MTTQATDIRHDHGIVREVAEVYREYADTVSRLRTVGTNEDSISEDFYLSAVKMYVDRLIMTGVLADLPQNERRSALIGLATISVRWARKVRIGTPPGMPDPVVKEGSAGSDT